jgi:hypothetical protein
LKELLERDPIGSLSCFYSIIEYSNKSRMPKYRNRVCDVCGDVKYTAGKSETCLKCSSELRYAKSRDVLKTRLEELGHTSVTIDGYTGWGSLKCTFTHLACDTTQTWSIGNLKKVLGINPDSAPCSKCGANTRMALARVGYKEKYGIDESRIAEWDTYRKLTRRLTEVTYRKHKDEINPENLSRSMKTFHLDHKVPIIYGFLNNLKPEDIAAKENLQILSASDNLSKARKSFTDPKSLLC